MTNHAIEATQAGDQDQTVGAIVMAFGSDPVARWAFPRPQQFLASFPAFVRAFGGAAFEHGTAHHVEGFSGAALWLPPGAQPDEQALVSLVEGSVDPERVPRFFALLEQMDHFHPTDPHWYLPLIGVDPVEQGRGHGSALLSHALQRVDQDHQPAYLESTNPANIPLYERHGFELTGTIEVAGVPPMFPMIRPAR
ncbi:MAG: N-acetyltransferase [Sandaracinaceae bacterium]|nr:MAG: N-acetyltransferase [Sandaracinaceae bacterium]